MTLIRRPWWSPLWLGVLFVALLAARALNRRDDWSGAIAFLVIIVAAPAGFLLTRLLCRRRLRRWAAGDGWAPIDPDERQWPWPPGTGAPPARGRVTIRQAWQRTIDGLSVTLAEAKWRGDPFEGLILLRKGQGAVVVVRLPQPSPPMALHHAFTPVGDSPRLDQPALREAYQSGAISTFAIRGAELFTVEPRDAWLDPRMAEEAVRRALHALRVLDLGPDTGPRIDA
jgi:hypothetical protein